MALMGTDDTFVKPAGLLTTATKQCACLHLLWGLWLPPTAEGFCAALRAEPYALGSQSFALPWNACTRTLRFAIYHSRWRNSCRQLVACMAGSYVNTGACVLQYSGWLLLLFEIGMR